MVLQDIVQHYGEYINNNELVIEQHTSTITPSTRVWTQLPNTTFNNIFKTPPLVSVFLYNKQYLDWYGYINTAPTTTKFGYVFYPTVANVEHTFIWFAIGKKA